MWLNVESLLIWFSTCTGTQLVVFWISAKWFRRFLNGILCESSLSNPDSEGFKYINPNHICSVDQSKLELKVLLSCLSCYVSCSILIEFLFKKLYCCSILSFAFLMPCWFFCQMSRLIIRCWCMKFFCSYADLALSKTVLIG